MFNIFKRFFDYNEKEVQKLKQIVSEINSLEDKARALKDFKKETEKLKEEVQSGKKTLDEILPWAYALVREVARKVIGERHFDVQLMAAVVLHQGKIAEQKTGEGKTLSATAPLYLNALSGSGVHLVTVNDYLARRDTGWMGQIFYNLGLKTAAIISDQSYIFDPSYVDEDAMDWRLKHLRPVSRDDAYKADITYGINSEFGFDYLRDNMAYSVSDTVQRGFNFAIIDEVDSVLIDEARTPHIISAPYEEDTSKYYHYAKIVEKLDRQEDFIIDEKVRTCHLTEGGILKIEKILGVENIYEKDFDTLFHIEAALKAKTLFKKDKDYILKDGEVIIVDEFTGRLLTGRRFSEGLHQAIEAKEAVAIKRESKTLATVSLQNYFRMYKKLAGMTGTAITEAEEFHKIYNIDTIAIPTHTPMIRKDKPDLIYKSENGKFKAVADEIASNFKKGRPVLVGTTSIEKNELLSRLLKSKGIPHEVLNAKNHEREAMIISNAGKYGAVTVATNMAGRGVDIVLGGEAPNRYEKEVKGTSYDKKMLEWRKAHDEVVKVGGLYVIGTERHESRRIDNQLRGRSGRQGDPGESAFFVSLEDDLMRIFGGEQVSKLMTFFKLPEDQPLTHAMVSKALEQAQVKVEGFNFDIRKHLVEFDDVVNKQREIIYNLRKKVLEAEKIEDFREIVENIFNEEIGLLVNTYTFSKEEPDLERLSQEFGAMANVSKDRILANIKRLSNEEIQRFLEKQLEYQFDSKVKEIGEDIWGQVARGVFLTTIDKYWTENLTAIEDLREGINLRGYAQLDPLVEFKNEAFSLFERLLSDINYEATRRILNIEVKRVEREVFERKDESKKEKKEYQAASKIDPYKEEIRESPAAEDLTTSHDQEEAKPIDIGGIKFSPVGTRSSKPGRNDPCWCGKTDPTTGKPIKYKKCHYPD